MDGAKVVEARGLRYSYGGFEALHGVDLEVAPGQAYALLGRNGAGKTTTLKAVAGLLRPSGGGARVLGRDARALGAAEWAAIGYVSEDQQPYPGLTMREILAFARRLYPAWDSELEARLSKRLALPLGKRVGSCSRGERIKLALVLAMPFRPRLLMIDEPFAGLDPVVCEDLLASLLEITNQEGWALLLATHDLDEVERLADRVGWLENGRMRIDEELSAIQARFRRVHVTLPKPLEASFECPGAAELRVEGAVLRFVHSAFDAQTEASLRQRLPGAHLDVRPMSLREIFLSLAGGSLAEVQ